MRISSKHSIPEEVTKWTGIESRLIHLLTDRSSFLRNAYFGAN